VLGVVLLGVDLFVFLQILRTFERLLADLANVGLERRMDCQTNTDEPRRVEREFSQRKKSPRRWLVI